MPEATRTGLTLTQPKPTSLNSIKTKLAKQRTTQKSTDISIQGSTVLQQRKTRRNSKSEHLTTQQLQHHVHAPEPTQRQQYEHNQRHSHSLSPVKVSSTANSVQNSNNNSKNDSKQHKSVISTYINQFRYAPPTAPEQRTDIKVQHNDNSTTNSNSKLFWWQQIDIPSEYIQNNNKTATQAPVTTQTPLTQRRARINIDALEQSINTAGSVPSTARSIAESSADIAELINNSTAKQRDTNMYNTSDTRILHNEFNDTDRSYDSIDEIQSQYTASPEPSSRTAHNNKRLTYNLDIDSILKSQVKKPITIKHNTKHPVQHTVSTSQDVDDLLSMWRKQQQYGQTDANDILTARISDTVDMLNAASISDNDANKLFDELNDDNIDVDTIINRLRGNDITDTAKVPSKPVTIPTAEQVPTQSNNTTNTTQPQERSNITEATQPTQLTKLQQAATTETPAHNDARLNRILTCAVDGVQLNVNNTPTSDKTNDGASIKIHIKSTNENDTVKSEKHCCHCPPVCVGVASQHAEHHACCPSHVTDTRTQAQSIDDTQVDTNVAPSDENKTVHDSVQSTANTDTQPALVEHTESTVTETIETDVLDSNMYDSTASELPVHDIIDFDTINNETTAPEQSTTNIETSNTTTQSTSLYVPAITMEQMFDQLMRHALSNTETVDRTLLNNLLQFSLAAHQKQQNEIPIETTHPVHYSAIDAAVLQDATTEPNVQTAPVSVTTNEPIMEPVIQPTNVPPTTQTDQITSMLTLILQSLQQVTQSRRHSTASTDHTSHAITNVDVQSIDSASETVSESITPTAALPTIHTEQIASESNMEPIEPVSDTVAQNTDSTVQTTVEPVSNVTQPLPQTMHVPTFIPTPMYPFLQYNPLLLQPTYATLPNMYNPLSIPMYNTSFNYTLLNQTQPNLNTSFIPIQPQTRPLHVHNERTVQQNLQPEHQPLFTDMSQFNVNESIISNVEPKPTVSQPTVQHSLFDNLQIHTTTQLPRPIPSTELAQLLYSTNSASTTMESTGVLQTIVKRSLFS